MCISMSLPSLTPDSVNYSATNLMPLGLFEIQLYETFRQVIGFLPSYCLVLHIDI